MANVNVKCPECGREFPAEAKWTAKDWVLYAFAVGPVGLMALAIVGVAVVAMLRMVGLFGG